MDTVDRALRKVELTARVEAAAADLAEQHALSGFDAVHLANALTLTGLPVVVATWGGTPCRSRLGDVGDQCIGPLDRGVDVIGQLGDESLALLAVALRPAGPERDDGWPGVALT